MVKKKSPNSRRSHSRAKSRSSSSIVAYLDKIDRVQLVMAGFGLLVALILIRLFFIQVVKHSFYEAMAKDTHALIQELMPSRGEIFAQDRYAENGLAVIATNQTQHSVYLNPMQVTDANAIADHISTILAMDPEVVRERAGKEDDVYEPLTTASDQQIEAIEQAIDEFKLSGIYWAPEDKRFYPEGESVATVTGFVGMVDDEKKGQYGLEGYFNEELAGVKGESERQRDAFGRYITVGDSSIEHAQDGETIVTTIDKNIQYNACTALQKAVEKHQAERGTVIVMDTETGAILAMCDAPTYDPNDYGNVDKVEQYMNDAISKQYEPGSVLKSIAMAATINEGAVSPYTTFNDTGTVEIAGHDIHNSDGKANGVVDMTYVLEYSLNTGCIWAVQHIGNEKWYDYMQKFGFGQRTGIAMSGENPGDISAVSQLKDIYTATSCYGQGMTATPIQLIQAYGAIANDGTMMKPYIVDRVIKDNGYEEVTQPEVVGQPISAETARTVSAMLVRVIEDGHTTAAQIPGYHVAGKTGTAQIANPDGSGYLGAAHNDTFIGFASVSNPEVVVLTNIDQPKDVPWADASAAPLFAEIGQFLVNYLQIEPDREE